MLEPRGESLAFLPFATRSVTQRVWTVQSEVGVDGEGWIGDEEERWDGIVSQLRSEFFRCLE